MLHVARMRIPSLVPRAKDTRAAEAAPRDVTGWQGFDVAFGGADLIGWDSDVERMADMMKD
jgi:hypothetical protein